MSTPEYTQPPAAVETRILSIGEVLEQHITLPDYQRPYKWQSEHVRQLLNDLRYHQRKNAYRLGSFVFHKHKTLDIVDGQQRLVTLLLIITAIQKKADRLIPATFPLLGILQLPHEESRKNVIRNYQEILNSLGSAELNPAFVDFLLNTCEVVCFTLAEVSEAFQFFDSQNARGKPLEPHDLLKAYHLREFSPVDEALKAETVEQWEAIEEQDAERRGTELKHLFGEYLYRIRQWSRGQRAQQFRSRDIGVFKGINPETADDDFPHLRALKMAHYFVDDYNTHFSRRIDRQAMPYPFSLDQAILNGRRFFEMVTHYQQLGFHRGHVTLPGGDSLNDLAQNILQEINQYEGNHRTGDRYVRNLFDCLLMYYCDKFGSAELSRAIEKIFIWAYTLRLENYAVQWASVENHVKADNRFITLRDSCRPEDFLSKPCRALGSIKREVDSIQKLFSQELLPQRTGEGQ